MKPKIIYTPLTINSEIILGKKDKGKLQQWTIYEQHPDF